LADPKNQNRDVEPAYKIEPDQIERLPHLSAPIDEGQFFPTPRLRFRDVAWRIVLATIAVVLLATLIFARGTLFR
jgi:hypothetical protein